MGYRTTFVSDDLYVSVPRWFVDKWGHSVNFGTHTGIDGPTFPISSKFERKMYDGVSEDIFLDLSKILRESVEHTERVSLVLLHEDGYIDKVTITKTSINLEGSLKYDEEDNYNPQLGNRDEEYLVGGVQ